MSNLFNRRISLSNAARLDRLIRTLPRRFRPCFAVQCTESDHPILCRIGTSDLRVIHQVYVDQHYNVDHLPDDADCIFDCGANIGASAAWFGGRYPNATIVSLEPDPQNYWLLKQNTSHLGDRVRTLRGGLWSHPTRLDLRPGHDFEPWSIRVVEDPTGPIEGFSIAELMSNFNIQEIDILKIDIERAEEIVLSSSQDWIRKVRLLLVEFHSDRSLSFAKNAFGDTMRQVESKGETSVFVRTSDKVSM